MCVQILLFVGLAIGSRIPSAIGIVPHRSCLLPGISQAHYGWKCSGRSLSLLYQNPSAWWKPLWRQSHRTRHGLDLSLVSVSCIQWYDRLTDCVYRYIYKMTISHAKLDSDYTQHQKVQRAHLCLFCVCRSIDQNLVTVGWRRGVFDETAVVTSFVHPTFAGNEKTLDYAFAILQLADSSSASDVVQLNSDPSVPDSETELTVLGSGFDTTLNEANVFALTDEECAGSQNLAGFPMQVGASQMCAGDGGSGFCVEDWGGPLVIQSNDTDTTTTVDVQDVQVGVAAWYEKICEVSLIGTSFV